MAVTVGIPTIMFMIIIIRCYCSAAQFAWVEDARPSGAGSP